VRNVRRARPSAAEYEYCPGVRPVIGITAYVEPARWGVWDLVATLLPHRYVEHVVAAGGRPVLLPPYADFEDGDAADLVGRLDGLLLAGGADIDPQRYGAQRHVATTGLRPDRDASELGFLRAALDTDTPVLGVCRGMQLLTVAAGGTLHQHLPDVVGSQAHRPAPGQYGDHPVRLDPRSRVGRILGGTVDVRSYHHQGIASTGTATAVGWAAEGTVEAVELPDHRFVLGVLWHPEAGADPRLFRAFVDAARTPTTAA